jgi:hypothetical protein
MAGDHETFWAAFNNGRRCPCCGNTRAQYRARFVDYNGTPYVKPLGRKIFCVGCNTNIGSKRLDMWAFSTTC